MTKGKVFIAIITFFLVFAFMTVRNTQTFQRGKFFYDFLVQLFYKLGSRNSIDPEFDEYLDFIIELKKSGREGHVIVENAGAVGSHFDILNVQAIKLKVSKNTIYSGGEVHFEAIPSSAIKTNLPDQITLFTKGELSKTVILSKAWFRNVYRGTLKFDKPTAGFFRFAVLMLPLSIQEKNSAIFYTSNTVDVRVKPRLSDISTIFLDEGKLFLFEGMESPLYLRAKGVNGLLYDISSPEIGVSYAIDDETIAVVSWDEGSGRYPAVYGRKAGRTKLRALFYNLVAEVDLYVSPPDHDMGHYVEPPKPERPYPIAPTEGMVFHKGVTIRFEVSSFDTSKGHVFDSSWWSIKDPRGREIAYLHKGESNVAEWTPRVSGTFEWSVEFSYRGEHSGFTDASHPVSIVITKD